MTSVKIADPLFDRDGWWDSNCQAFASLRSVTAFRLDLLRQWLHGGIAGRTIVDLGCGGGLLAVPLAREGARVIAIDIARSALRSAQTQQAPGLTPIVGEIGAVPLADGVADIVLLADVVEHVGVNSVVEAARLLRRGGHLFVNTIDRTLRSRLFAIALGEGLGFIPRGTHRWEQFVRPDELDSQAAAAGLKLAMRSGEAPKIFETLRRHAVVLRKSRSLAVGYAALYEKSLP